MEHPMETISFISIHHPRALEIIEVLWNPPIQNWIKGNIDGS